MGLFRRAAPAGADDLERLKAEMGTLRAALDDHRASPPTPPTPQPDGPRESLAELVARVEEVAGRHGELDGKQVELSGRFAEVEGKLAQLDARVTAVARELTNQLTELGHDIDALDEQSAAGAPVDDAVLGEIRDGQVRLASEQARYQIAFRDDLARLAEQLRRPGA